MSTDLSDTEKLIYVALDFFLENLFYSSVPDEEIMILDILLRMAPKDDKDLEERVNDFVAVNPNIPKEIIEAVFKYLMVRAKYFESRKKLLVGQEQHTE